MALGRQRRWVLLALGAVAAGMVLRAARLPAAVEADSTVPREDAPKLIALTFDDGPRRSTTARLLDGLGERGVHATFFVIGKQLPDNEDLILRMEAEGHEVGIHTFDHVPLTDLSAADFDAQVGKTRRLLQNLLGREDFPLRPPYGALDDAVRQNAQAPIILWSVDPEDWGDKDPQRETAHILEKARDGSIVLLHDIYPQSVDAALQVVDALHAQGYVFLTVSELYEARGVDLVPGCSYRQAYPDATDWSGY